MSKVIKKIKVMKDNGTFTEPIPIGANAENVKTEDGITVEEKIGKKTYYFNNVAEMKAYKLKNGDYVTTLGYYATNDGGGANYLIRTKTNADVQDNGSIHFVGSNLVAELIVENNTINIKQLGAKCLSATLVKYDIAPQINLYKNLVSYNKSSLKLYIPSGIWFTSGNNFKNPNNCNIYGDGIFSYGSGFAIGTVISSFTDNQNYIFKIGDESKYCQQFSIKDITFSSAEFTYDNENNKFLYGTLKTVGTGVKFILASYGTTENLRFIYLKGESLSIASTWEVDFGKMYFRYVSNHNGNIMTFKEGLGTWTNISACVFDYLMFESFHGNLIGLEDHCGLYNNHFNTINVEDRDFIENNEEYITITDEMISNWDDEDYIHLSLFKLDEGARANGNVINNLELNNYPNHILRWNENDYIYDTIVKYNNDVTFSNIFNNIVVQGASKNTILFKSENYSQTNSQIPKFYNLLNNSYFDFELQVEGIDNIYVSGNLKGAYKVGEDIIPEKNINSQFGGWLPCYETKAPYGTNKFIYSDSETINKLNIAVIPRTEDSFRLTYSMTSIVNPVKKIYLRAKIPSGEEVKLYIDDFTNTSGSKVNYVTGTGNYTIYELEVGTGAVIGDKIGVRFGGNEQGRVLTRNIRMDSFISI